MSESAIRMRHAPARDAPGAGSTRRGEESLWCRAAHSWTPPCCARWSIFKHNPIRRERIANAIGLGEVAPRLGFGALGDQRVNVLGVSAGTEPIVGACLEQTKHTGARLDRSRIVERDEARQRERRVEIVEQCLCYTCIDHAGLRITRQT